VFPLNLYARVRFCYVHFARETAGAARTRSSLRPLSFPGVRPSTTRVHSAPREFFCCLKWIGKCAAILLTLPWRGRHRRPSAAVATKNADASHRLCRIAKRCETGWGDLSTRALFETRDCHPTPPLRVDPKSELRSSRPLQGRVRTPSDISETARSRLRLPRK
jgi:hypothetical protein